MPVFACQNESDGFCIMVDGTGMCGACRITVGNKTKFVCVDGPEFDAHQVNFDEMLQRLAAYKDEEAKAFERHQKETGHECRAEAKLKSQ